MNHHCPVTMNLQPSNPNTEIDATERIAQLEASNAALREALVSKNSHISMLEERLLNMSVELASSRAREDEQYLVNRQSQISQVSMMSEAYDPADNIDDSTKSAPVQRRPSDRPRFSFMSGWRSSLVSQDDSMGSSRSLNSTGVGGIIGNIIKLDRSDKSEDLNVDFPTGGRRRSMMIDESNTATTAPNSPFQEQRRMTLPGFRKSELTADDAVAETSCEHHEEEQAPSLQRRRPNRTKMLKIQASTRLISSTVAFPREDDSDSMGFDFD